MHKDKEVITNLRGAILWTNQHNLAVVFSTCNPWKDVGPTFDLLLKVVEFKWDKEFMKPYTLPGIDGRSESIRADDLQTLESWIGQWFDNKNHWHIGPSDGVVTFDSMVICGKVVGKSPVRVGLYDGTTASFQTRLFMKDLWSSDMKASKRPDLEKLCDELAVPDDNITNILAIAKLSEK